MESSIPSRDLNDLYNVGCGDLGFRAFAPPNGNTPQELHPKHIKA